MSTYVYPGKTVLYRPTSHDVLASGQPYASEDGLYPLLVSSVNWKKDANGDHTEAGYDSVNGVVTIDGAHLAVHGVPEGTFQGSFCELNQFNEPPVVAPRTVVSGATVGRGAPVGPANPNIPVGLSAAIQDTGAAGNGVVTPVATETPTVPSEQTSPVTGTPDI